MATTRRAAIQATAAAAGTPPPRPRGPYVFISYASKDRPQVLRLVDLLEAAGVPLWFDRNSIPGGANYGPEIVDGIRGCRALVLVCSPHSLRSRNVKQEIQLAWKYKRPYVPLLLSPTPIPKQLEYWLEGWQWIELLDQPEAVWLPRLLDALKRQGIRSQPVAAETLAGGPPPAAPAPARPRKPPTPTSNLPEPLTSFVGRQRERQVVAEALAQHRLVTLTGAGGCGKTRLALAVAHEQLTRYPDGVWWVELAALREEGLLAQEVAAALGVREQPGEPIQTTLLNALKSKQLLLVLDNCEHLVTACAHLVERLLRACPKLRVLTTSREALASHGERVVKLAPLALPDPRRLPPLDDLAEVESVALFLERARAHQPSFGLTPQNAAAVAQLCRRLDGIPLALELAAARIKVLPPEQLAARLDDRFRLLTAGTRTALPQHQTLRATLDWSHELLAEPERMLFRRLSVFAGYWTLEAAEQVCAGEGIEEWEVLDLVARLVDKSLVAVDEAEGLPQHYLLESVRQYGLEKLRAAGEEAGVRARHRDWYLALAEQAEPELIGPRQVEWLERLDGEQDDLRAALAWCEQDPDSVEAGLRIANALYWFWYLRSQYSEGRGWLERLLARADAVSPRLRAVALNWAGGLACQLSDYDRARELLEQALALGRDIDDKWATAHALNNLGIGAQCLGDPEQAARLYEESLALFRETGDRLGTTMALNNLGLALFGQDPSSQQVAALLEEGVALARELGNKGIIAATIGSLADVARRQGDLRRARHLYEEGLAICQEVGDKENVAYLLEGLAAIAAAEGEPERAAEVWGAAEALREEIGTPIDPDELPDHEGDVAGARSRLDEAAFAAAWQRGRALALDDAIARALARTARADQQLATAGLPPAPEPRRGRR